MSFESVREEFLTCHKCGKKMGIIPVTSIGTPHQFNGKPTCIKCLPELLKESLKKHPELKDRVKLIKKWLDSD